MFTTILLCVLFLLNVPTAQAEPSSLEFPQPIDNEWKFVEHKALWYKLAGSGPQQVMIILRVGTSSKDIFLKMIGQCPIEDQSEETSWTMGESDAFVLACDSFGYDITVTKEVEAELQPFPEMVRKLIRGSMLYETGQFEL